MSEARTGDRIGACVKGLAPDSERGLLVDEDVDVIRGKQFLAKCNFSKHFPIKIKQGQHFSINFGSETLGAKIYVFEKSVCTQLKGNADTKRVQIKRLMPEDITSKHAHTVILDFENEQNLVQS